jgi:DNA-binding NtrC family response regulator
VNRAPARILFVEDSADDVELELAVLRGAGLDIEHEVVDGPEELRAALAQQRWDVVLSDFRLPEFSGIDALQIVREFDRDVGFILISGTVGEDLAVDAMRAGANDYVLKDNLTRMPAVVERELREGVARRERSRIEREQVFFIGAQQFLADVGRVLGRSRDAEDTLRESARLAVPILADWVTSYILEGSCLRVVERTAADPTR